MIRKYLVIGAICVRAFSALNGAVGVLTPIPKMRSLKAYATVKA